MINTRVHAQRRGYARSAHNETRASLREARTHNVATRCNYRARGSPRIMYLEQEVEKIRRPAVINNPRLLAEQFASLRPQRRAAVTPFYRAVYTGCPLRACNNNDRAVFSVKFWNDIFLKNNRDRSLSRFNFKNL